MKVRAFQTRTHAGETGLGTIPFARVRPFAAQRLPRQAGQVRSTVQPERAAPQVSTPGLPDGVVQRTDLVTHGGTFNDVTYKPIPLDTVKDPTRVGCQMMLRFTVFPGIPCEKYGLVQMVDYQDDGTPTTPDGWPDTQRRAVNPGQFIDKKHEYINPVFTGGNPPAIFAGKKQYRRFRRTLSKEQRKIIRRKREVDEDSGWVFIDMDFTPQERATLGDAVMGMLGEHMEPATGLGYTEDKDVLTASGRGVEPTDEEDEEEEEEEHDEEAEEGEGARSAMLYDRPSHPMTQTKLSQDTVTSSRKFETAALCLKGTMEGTYLGSVEWGFYTRNRQIHLYPFRIVSMGAPSVAFQAAAQGWNQSTVTVGDKRVTPMQLPSNAAAPTAAAPATRNGLADRINQVRVLYRQLADVTDEARVNQRKNVQLEASYLQALVKTQAGGVHAADATVAIQSGETLRDFAFRTTGDRNNWVEIMALNSDLFNVLGGPSVGQKLKIPRSA